MAFGSFFTLLDDITAVLDDVSLMTKVATKKTAGVIGDDLAVNANQVTGVRADRELPIVWAVTKGSLINKAILIPLALALSYFAPQWVVVLLMIGGAFLCFEGVEKILETFFHKEKHEENQPIADNLTDEKGKIMGAIRTDMILSAEIIIITLGEIPADAHIGLKLAVLTLMGVGITIFVYGLVALIVKADDFGLYLMRQKDIVKQALGRTIIRMMPYFMRALSVIGMLAMFLVGGGIFMHNVDALHHIQWNNGLVELLATLILGIIIGAVVCAVVLPLSKLLGKSH